jgi:hypothetical protein
MVDYEVTDKEDGHAHLILRGRLVGDLSSEQLKGELERHYVDDGVTEIRVDVGDSPSSAWRASSILVELWRESLDRGKRFVLRDASGSVRGKLVTTGVLDLLEGDRSNMWNARPG